LIIDGYNYSLLYGNHVSIANGIGLYGNSSLGNSLEVFFKDHATLKVVSGNNRSSNYDNVSNIVLQNNKPIQVYLWQPQVNINGTTIFEQFLGKDVLGNTVSNRKDLNISGNVSLTLLMSDNYTYGSDISVNGPVQQLPVKYQYNEMGSLMALASKVDFNAVPIAVDGFLSIPFLVATILLLFGKSKHLKKFTE